MRQIVLDTETTGLEVSQGHRVIEIGCVELIDRRLTGNNFHVYLNPERSVDEGAEAVHGITNEFLADKPLMVDVCDEFIEYVKDAELVIHNADFDTEFIDHEFHLLGRQQSISEYCSILDTLAMARDRHPGQKNTLDALCTRYDVDNSQRDLHGALLDARILADVYLAMTGGQVSLLGGERDLSKPVEDLAIVRIERELALNVIAANEAELAAHDDLLEFMRKEKGSAILWDGTSE